ncbi:hypothetical protein Fot_15670 [Forsythia ovata]|uniref:Uncharacterized protein n=1 Tax=Forsythia ovata TaxID=205694 RepID=A0ABD1WA48_9LAMI
MVFTVEGNDKGDGVVFGGYDTRMPRRVPAISAEWRSPDESVTAVVSLATSSVEKVYLRDNVTGVLTVGDVRNVTVPLENVVEYELGGSTRHGSFPMLNPELTR